MSLEPLSDDEVDEDGSSYVRARSGVDRAVRKAKVQMKTWDCQYSGRYTPGLPGSNLQSLSVNCIYDTDTSSWNGCAQWAYFYPWPGSGEDDLQGTDESFVDGIKYSIFAYIPIGSLVDDNQPVWEESRVPFFCDIVFCPDPWKLSVDEDPTGRLLWNNLYDFCLAKEQGAVAFLKRDAIRRGCKILKRWQGVLDRELYNSVGREGDSCVWKEVASSGAGYSVGGETVYDIGGVPLENVAVGERTMVKNYGLQTAAEKSLWAPAQYQFRQYRNYFQDSGFFKVNRKVQSLYPTSNENYPSTTIRRGVFYICCWSTHDVTSTGGGPGYEAYASGPQIELHLRFKFHQKN